MKFILSKASALRHMGTDSIYREWLAKIRNPIIEDGCKILLRPNGKSSTGKTASVKNKTNHSIHYGNF